MSVNQYTARIDLKTLYLLLSNRNSSSDFGDKNIQGIYVADERGDTIWVSSGCEQFWGYTASELIGKNVMELERKGVFVPSGVRKVLESNRRVQVLQETCTGRQLHIVGNPVYTASRKVYRVINGLIDVTRTENGNPETIPGPVFQSEEMKKINSMIRRVGPLETTVLITGESGTGKGVVARSLHEAYKPAAPFVKIDCSAIAHNLIESELFGYERGAFSGAERGGKKGQVEQAQGGTLFLDEIGEVPLDLQGKFLRLIQEKTFVRVGGVKENFLEARIIAATNRDLEKMVSEGRFRSDLYYRLKVIPIHIPPLREHRIDIPVLIEYFRQRFEKRYGFSRKFTPSVISCLTAYDWPGNIRELENTIERLIVFSEKDIIDVDELPLQISKLSPHKPIEIEKVMPLRDGLRLTEEKLIQLAWQKYGTTTGVAKALGIDQSTASRKIRKYLASM